MAKNLQEQLADLAKPYYVTALYVFGSQARETADLIRGVSFSAILPEKDVDIGVQILPGKRLTAQERIRLILALEDMLKAGRVDLTVLSEAPPFLALDIIKGELVYCEDPDRQAEDELYILRRAGDLAYFERQRRQIIIEGEPL